MSKPKLTPWIDGSVKPTRVGVYERDYGQRWNKFVCREYQFWDGSKWHFGTSDIDETMTRYEEGHGDICTVHHDWRGLASDPSKGAK